VIQAYEGVALAGLFQRSAEDEIIVLTNIGSIADGAGRCSERGLNKCGQATKGTWGMSWRQKAVKGVEDCEKLGGTVNRVLSPSSFPTPMRWSGLIFSY
jgi:hypothetical protein